MLNSRNLFILALIVLAAVLRVSGNLPYNFTPVAAIALFGGAMLSNRTLGFIAPLAIMLVSDIFIGFHSSMFAVYAALIGIVLIGQLVRKTPTMLRAFGGAIAGAVLFFLVTNAAAWLVLPQYTKDLSGLINSYVAGVPFFRGTLMSDLLFTGICSFALECCGMQNSRLG